MASAVDHLTIYRDQISAQRDGLDMMLVQAQQNAQGIIDERLRIQTMLDDINVALATISPPE